MPTIAIDLTAAPRTIQAADTPAAAQPAVATEPPSLLPSAEAFAGDPIAMLAALMVKAAQQKSASDDVSAKAEEKAEDAADARRVDGLKSKAEHDFQAGMIGGISQVAAGAASFGAGVAGARAAGDGASAASAASAPWEASSTMAGGTGKILETYGKSLAENDGVNVAKAESDSKIAKRAADQLNKQVDTAAQHEDKVIQLLTEIKQAQEQCQKAALMRM